MNLLKIFLKSVYSPKDIAKFRFLGIGKTILFVFLLSLFSILPTTLYLAKDLTNGINTVKESLDTELPSFTIENGQLSVDVPSPVILEKDDLTIVLDDSGTMGTEDFDRTDNVIALLKNEFLFIAGGQGQTSNYAMFNEMKVAKKDVIDFLDILDDLKTIIIPLFIIIFFIFSSAIKFIEVTILALIGLILTNFLKRNVHYRQLWRMAAYSVTLPTIFFTIMDMLQTQVPNGFIINWFVAIIVLGLAINEIPIKKQKTENL